MAEAQRTWRGFDPTGYTIDWNLLLKAPLIEMGLGSNQVQTTAGNILREAMPHFFTPLNPDRSLGIAPSPQICEVEQHPGRLNIKTPERVIRLNTLGNDTRFTADLVATIITVDRLHDHKSINPIFFYYDRDYVVDDVVHESFDFFVVNDGRFALDTVTFFRDRESGFDPNVFEPHFARDRQIWDSEPGVLQAQVRWWYRRFYEETEAGRLTLLRDDANLYHYVPESKQRQSMAENIELIARRTARIQSLFIYALIALGLIVVLLWR